MMRRNTLTAALTFAVVALLVCPAFAQDTGIEYDPDTRLLKYWVKNGDPGTEYRIHITPSGCVEVAPSDTLLDGPNDSAWVEILCVEPDGNGKVQVAFCVGENCFAMSQALFRCVPPCRIFLQEDVPLLTETGAAVLLLALVISAVWIVRRRRRVA